MEIDPITYQESGSGNYFVNIIVIDSFIKDKMMLLGLQAGETA